jgi:uncharacterized protein YndB with AHSA1/START domain
MSTSTTADEAGAIGKSDGTAVSVSQEVSAPLGHVWEVLVSPQGSAALLGEGAVLGGKGEPYHCSDGTRGVVRSYHPLEQLRLSWHATEDAPPSLVEIDLTGQGATTLLELRHEHLDGAGLADAVLDRWTAGLEALAARATA